MTAAQLAIAWAASRGDDIIPLIGTKRRDRLAEALGAYTAGSAYVNHLDGQTGAIEPGMLADLTVLNRDPFDAPPGEIAATRVLLTCVEGERVYTADDL